MALDRPQDAEPLYREALDMQRKLLGDAHPDLALALNNLGYARERRGDYRGAEAAYQEALKMNRALLGERHPGSRQHDGQPRIRDVCARQAQRGH